MAMAFQAGMLNAGGFLACHQFVSHVTGFATLFGVEFLNNDFSSALAMLTVPICFMIGAMFSGQLIDIKLQAKKEPKYYLVYCLLTMLLTGIAIAGSMGYMGKFGEPLVYTRDYTLLILLCFVCGVQNATITSSSKAVVRTTHLTGITTDLGIGIIRYINRHSIEAISEYEGRANTMRFGLIIFFLLGSLGGAFLFFKYEFKGFFLPALISFSLFFVTIRRSTSNTQHNIEN